MGEGNWDEDGGKCSSSSEETNRRGQNRQSESESGFIERSVWYCTLDGSGKGRVGKNGNRSGRRPKSASREVEAASISVREE